MKQATKIILFSAVIAVVLGSILFAVGYFSSNGNIGMVYTKENGWQRSNLPGARETFIIEQSVDNLNLNVSLGEIKFIPTDEAKIRVEYRVDPNSSHSVDGTTLTLTQSNNNSLSRVMKWNLFTIVDEDDYTVNLYFPRNTKFVSVKIDADLGALKVEDLKADTFSAIVGLGSVSIKNSDFNEIDIDSDQGSCELKNVTAAVSAKMELGLGSLNLNTAVLANPYIRLDLGSFNSKDSNYTGLNLRNGMGSITMNKDSLYGANEVKSDLGSVDLKLSGERNQYVITSNVDLGEAKVEGNNPASAENSIDITSGLGSVRVRFDR